MAVRSITGSSRHGPKSTVQNPAMKNFVGNTENTPLMSASSRLDLNIDQDRIDETRNFENFEDGVFPPSRPNYDQQAHITIGTRHSSLQLGWSVSQNWLAPRFS